jgi:putative phosphoesterase
MRIGIISDTHGLLRPEAIKQLAGADHIIHAGDIGAPEVIEGLRRIAPITAIRGNIDVGEWAKDYPGRKAVAARRGAAPLSPTAVSGGTGA